MRMWSQISSPLYIVENNSSSKAIPSTLGSHGGGSTETVYVSFICIPFSLFISGKVDGHNPTFLGWNFTSSSTTWERSTPGPSAPLISSPHLLPLFSLFPVLCHSDLDVSLSLRQFPTQGPPCCFPCLDGSCPGGCRTHSLPPGRCSNVTSESLSWPLHRNCSHSVAVACFIFPHRMYHLLLCGMFVLH